MINEIISSDCFLFIMWFSSLQSFANVCEKIILFFSSHDSLRQKKNLFVWIRFKKKRQKRTQKVENFFEWWWNKRECNENEMYNNICVSKVWINSVLKLFRRRMSYFVGKFSHLDIFHRSKTHTKSQIQRYLTLWRKKTLTLV